MASKAETVKTPTFRPGSTAGFTVFELIVVLILLAAVAAVIMPSFSGGLKSLEVTTSARDLVTHMRAARSRAISYHRVFRVVLHEEADGRHSYSLTNDYGQPFKTVPLPEGVSYSTPGGQMPYLVSFYPDGSSSGGEFSLRSERGLQLFVTVDPVTGLGRVSRNNEE